MIIRPVRGQFSDTYALDFRTEATRNIKSDASNYVDSKGATWSFENAAAAGATFGIGASGLTIVGTAGVNVSGATRTAPLARVGMPSLGGASRRDMFFLEADIQVTAASGSIGALILFESTDAQNSSRNYIGVVSGTPTISSQRTISGTQTTVGTPLTPGSLNATIRFATLIGSMDWDFYGDGAALPWPVGPAAMLNGTVTRTTLTDGPVGWDANALWDPSSTSSHLVFSVAGTATLVVQRLRMSRMDLGRIG